MSYVEIIPPEKMDEMNERRGRIKTRLRDALLKDYIDQNPSIDYEYAKRYWDEEYLEKFDEKFTHVSDEMLNEWEADPTKAVDKMKEWLYKKTSDGNDSKMAHN